MDTQEELFSDVSQEMETVTDSSSVAFTIPSQDAQRINSNTYCLNSSIDDLNDFDRTCDEITVQIGTVENPKNPGVECDVLMSRSVPEGSVYVPSNSQECANTEEPKIMGMFLSPLENVVKASKEKKDHISTVKDSMIVNCSFSSQIAMLKMSRCHYCLQLKVIMKIVKL